MANQVAARLSGDDYQHLYAWWCALELLLPDHHVHHVTVEDAEAGSVDDVTVTYENGQPSRFYQVKYHVDQRESYSTEALVTKKSANEASLLEKFWRTWRVLQDHHPQRPVELLLLSNWTWRSDDPLRMCISGYDTGLKDEFFSALPGSAVGRARQRWQAALEADDQAFSIFARSLRFRLGFDCADELEQRVAERMERLNLRSDVAALLVAVGIVRGWIKTGRQDITRDLLERELHEKDLALPSAEKPGIMVYLTTIKEQHFNLPPDYLLDWRDAFAGPEHTKGHAVRDPAAWNTQMLPELAALEARIGRETDDRLIRVRGRARLSAWFAFGAIFSEVAGYTIAVEQGELWWRTDTPPSPDFLLDITSQGGTTDGEVLDAAGRDSGDVVAVGISVSASLEEDLRAYLRICGEPVQALLLLRPHRELGRTCLRDAGDAVALGDEVKQAARAFVKRRHARRLLLFYCGPLSGACMIGHRLNAVCHQIQIMEDQQPGYALSFLLQ